MNLYIVALYFWGGFPIEILQTLLAELAEYKKV